MAGGTGTGWDGCISLRGSITGTSTTYGLQYTPTATSNNLTGYAWGGSTMGWIGFTNATLTLPAPTLSITANGNSTTTLPSSGGSVSLVWTTTNLASTDCTASGDWSGPRSSGGGSQLLSFDPNLTTSTTTKTYTISGCTSISGAAVPTGSSTATVIIAPNGGSYLSFKGNGETNVPVAPGGSVNLTWEVQNIAANACVGTSSGSFSGWAGTTKVPSVAVGSTAVTYSEIVGADGSITSPETYTMTCGSLPPQTVTITPTFSSTSGNGTVNFTVDGDPVSHNLPASGGNVTLAWSTDNLTTADCTASGDWSGAESSSGGNQLITLPVNTTSSSITKTYTLGGCVDLNGLTIPDKTVTVTIAGTGPSLVFQANGGDTANIPAGSSVTLSWTLQSVALNTCVGTSSGNFTNWNTTTKGPSPAVGATSTTFSETVGTDGSITSTRTYTMTCTGIPAQTVTINIIPPSAISLTANGESAELDLPSSGGSVVLAWTTAGLDATNCVANSSDPAYGTWSGSKTYLGGSDAAFTLPSNGSTTNTVVRTYTLSGCMANGISVPPQTVTVVVETSGTPYLSLVASNGTVTGDTINALSSDTINLTWTVQNVIGGSCKGTSSGSYTGWSSTGTVKSPSTSVGGTATSFTEVIGSFSSPRAYTMTCTGSDGTTLVYKTATINVDTTQPYLSLVASDGTATGTTLTVLSTANVTLTWQMQNIAHGSCNATSNGAYSGWNNTSKYPLIGDASIGATLTSHSESVGTATTSRIYTLSCTGTNGVPISDVVVVGITGSTPFLGFYASAGATSGDNITIPANAPLTLSWSVQNVASCIASSSAGDWSGTVATSVGTTLTSSSQLIGIISSSPRTYTMTCGSLVKTVTVNIYSGGCYLTCSDSRAHTTLTVNGDPSIILPPTASTASLSWTTTNLLSGNCTANSSAGDWTGSASSAGGTYGLSYSASTSTVAVPKTYTLSGCISSIDSTIVPPKTVTVTIAPYGTPFLSFSVNGTNSITLSPSGSSATLTWQLQNTATNTCVGTSSGGFSNWNSTTKGPSSAVGTTPQIFSEIIGSAGDITSTRWYEMTCGTLPPQTVSIIVDPIPICPGDPSCDTTHTTGIITPPMIGGNHRPPWLEL